MSGVSTSVVGGAAPGDGGEVTEEELIEFCRDHIASYKKPRSVDFVDDLPRNNYGKIVKRELREAYWQGRERRV